MSEATPKNVSAAPILWPHRQCDTLSPCTACR